MARFSDVLTLRRATCEVGADGSPSATYEDADVFFNRYRLSLSAMLAGGADGLRRAAAGQVRSCDYAGQQLAVLDGEEYTVTAVNDQGEFTVLTLEGRLADG